MPIRGLNFVAQAISQADEQFDTFQKSKAGLHFRDLQGPLSNEEQKIAADLDQQIINGGEQRSGFQCPCCDAQMVLLSSGNTKLDFCLDCNAMWFDRGELKLLLHQKKDIPSDHLRSRGSRYDCPHCEVAMREFVFINPHNLLVDSCPQCHGVLLEEDEFERAMGLT